MKNIQTCTLIRNARDETGFSREKVAEFVGVSSTTIMRWEKGENKPFFHEIVKLADILQKPIEYFAGVEPSLQPKPSNLSGIFQTLAKHSRMIELMSQIDDEILETFEAEMEALVEARREEGVNKKKA